MNYIRGFTVVFITAYVVLQDQATGAALYRRQDLSTDNYLDSPRGQSTGYETRPKFSLNDVGYDMESEEPRPKESQSKLTPEEIIRQTRRERNRVLLGNPSSRRPSIAADEDDEKVETRAQTRYGTKYTTRDAIIGENTGGPRVRSSIALDMDYEDSDIAAGNPRNAGYDRFEYKRSEKTSPEPTRGAYKDTKVKYNVVDMNGQSNPSIDVESYDLKTLASIIQNLKSEKLGVDRTSKVVGEERRAKEMPDTKVRTNVGGIARQENTQQGNLNLEDYLISRNNGQKSRNVEQGTVRQESGIAAKEHVLRLLRELEKLEELRNLQKALETEDDTSDYYQLKQELAEDVKVVRMKVRDAIKQLQ